MADITYDPLNGSDANDGSTWALAKITLQAALTAAGVGGRVFSRNSNGGNEETYTGNSTQELTSPGTLVSPVGIYAVKNATTAFPPTDSDIVSGRSDADLALFYNFSGGGATNISFVGYSYYYGYYFKSGAYLSHFGADKVNYFEQCKLEWGGASSAERVIRLGTQSSTVYNNLLVLIDCELVNVGTQDRINFDRGGGRLFIQGGLVSGTGPGSANSFINGRGSPELTIRDFDFSAFTDANIDGIFESGLNAQAELHNCKMFTGWTLKGAGAIATGSYKAIQCDEDADHANPIIAYREEAAYGSTREETTVVRLGGAGDGITNYSFKLTPVADGVVEGLVPMYSPWLAVRVTTSDIKIEVYIHNTGADLDDGEVWLEVFSPNETAAASNATRTKDTTRKALLAAAATVTDDTAQWNGSANYSQKMSVAIAPDTDGIAHVRVAYAQRAASPVALYVHPAPVVT